MKFHTRCGSNILLSDGDTVAKKRKLGTSSNTTVFSSQPLGDETFTVRIQETCGGRVS